MYGGGMNMRVSMSSSLSVVRRMMWWPWNSCVGVFDDLRARFFAFLNDIAGTRASGVDLKFSLLVLVAHFEQMIDMLLTESLLYNGSSSLLDKRKATFNESPPRK